MPDMPKSAPSSRAVPPARDLSALLGSRLCHDLIGPISAIGNGIELISMEPRPKSGEMALLADSAAQASAKLRFFRVAFGTVGTGQSISRAEVQPLLAEVYRNGRIALDWSSPADLPRAEAKLAFLLLLCADHALPTGGTISVHKTAEGWSIRAASPRLRHDPALWSLLSDPMAAATVEPAQVQFPLAGEHLARLNRRATVEAGLAALTVSF